MDVEGYQTQEDDVLDHMHYFRPVDAACAAPPLAQDATNGDYSAEVDRILSGALLKEHFYYIKDDAVYALADSDYLKEAGDGAIPGFVCNSAGDYYKGHLLSYGPLMEIRAWVGGI